MKAISIKPPWSVWIRDCLKTIETRTWWTKHRGPLLIVSSKTADSQFSDLPSEELGPLGHAVAIVDLVDCRPMTEADQAAACCRIYPGAFAWVFENIRPINPFPVRGQQGLYEVELFPVKGQLGLFE